MKINSVRFNQFTSQYAARSSFVLQFAEGYGRLIGWLAEVYPTTRLVFFAPRVMNMSITSWLVAQVLTASGLGS